MKIKMGKLGKSLQNRRLLIMIVMTMTLGILIIKKTDSVKVSIKWAKGDWCVHAKNFKMVTVEECFWRRLESNDSKIIQLQQTFDIHPADIDEEDEADLNSAQIQPISFLFRLSRQPKKPGKQALPTTTTCLSSISSTLSVEKCHLRKSRFRLVPSFSENLQQAKHCSYAELVQAFANSQDVKYKIRSADQSCLQSTAKNKTRRGKSDQTTPTKTLMFTKCSALNVQQWSSGQHQLWQFCIGNNGNCSLSLFDLNWKGLIKTGLKLPNETVNVSNCKEKEETLVVETSSRLDDAEVITTNNDTIAAGPDLNDTLPTADKNSSQVVYYCFWTLILIALHLSI